MKQLLIITVMVLLLMSTAAATNPQLPLKTKNNNMVVETGPLTLVDQLFKIFNTPQAVRGLESSYAPGDTMTVVQYYPYSSGFTEIAMGTACTYVGQEYANHPDGGMVYLTFEIYNDDKFHQTSGTVVDWVDFPYSLGAGEFRAALSYLVPSSAIPGDTWSLSSYIKCAPAGLPSYEITGTFQSWGADELDFDIVEGFVYKQYDHYGCYPVSGGAGSDVYWYDNLGVRQNLVLSCSSSEECVLNGPLDADCVPICTDTVWEPSTSDVCIGEQFYQTLCEDTRPATGSKQSGTDIYNINCDTVLCGNGVLNGDEQCDGSTNAPSHGFCTSSCLIACDTGYSLVKLPDTSLSIVGGEVWSCIIDTELMCGNGEVNPPEECDYALPDPENGVCRETTGLYQKCTIDCNSGYELKLVNNAFSCVAKQSGGNGTCEDDEFSVSWIEALKNWDLPGNCYPRKEGLPRDELETFDLDYGDSFKADFSDPNDPVCLDDKMCAEGSSCVEADEDGDSIEQSVYEAFDEARTPGGFWGVVWNIGDWFSPQDPIEASDLGLCVEDSLTVKEALEKYLTWVEDTFGFGDVGSKVLAYLIIPFGLIFLLNFLLSPRRR